MPRNRDEEYSDEPPSRRRDDDDDDDYDDDRPRRLRRDDDYDYPDIRKKELSGLDAMFSNIRMPMLVVFGFCCNGFAMILGIVGLCVCKDENARSKALAVTIIGGVFTAIGIIYQVSESMK